MMKKGQYIDAEESIGDIANSFGALEEEWSHESEECLTTKANSHATSEIYPLQNWKIWSLQMNRLWLWEVGKTSSPAWHNVFTTILCHTPIWMKIVDWCHLHQVLKEQGRMCLLWLPLCQMQTLEAAKKEHRDVLVRRRPRFKCRTACKSVPCHACNSFCD